ncbi:substrate-binding periplasmic protein [Bdellovibrio sp. HCB337]|uniref:substrate-binding periplasmic protein n=1 Tax=Bdellovibrio sp. HCB337 TaxID=3394358 RepID=UPI0039A6D34A
MLKLIITCTLFFFLSPTSSFAAPSNDEYFGMTEDFPPFNFLDKEKVVGYSTDVIDLAFKKAQLKTTFTLWPWLRAFNQAKDTPKYYVYSTSRTPEREKQFKWVGPIAKDSVYLMVLKDSPIKDSADFKSLKKYSVSGQAGDQPVLFLQKNGFDVFIAADEAARMKMFKDKKIEMDIMTTGSQEIYEQLWNLKYRRVAFLYDTDYWAAFNVNTPDAVIAKLNKAVAEMKNNGTLDKIAEKYRAK